MDEHHIKERDYSFRPSKNPMFQENWKRIKNTYYEISDHGRVRNSTTGKILMAHVKKGYAYVYLYFGDGKKSRKGYLVHRLVATYFIDNPNQYKEVNHIDENKLNNLKCNLEWCSRRYNNAYGTRKERISLNNANRQPVIQYDKRGHFIKRHETIRGAASELGLRSSGISNCCAGRYSHCGNYVWRYVDE